MTREPRTEYIQIRVSKADKDRIARVAESKYLDMSAWMRSVVMQEVDGWEREQSGVSGEGA